MTTKPLLNLLKISVVLMASIMTGVGCTTSLKKIDQIDPNTANIEATIKAALISAKEVDAAAILITVINENEVSLSGFVASEGESSEAERLAKNAQPGVQIINELSVRN